MKIGHSKSMGCRKADVRAKFIAIQPYFKKQEKHQINNLTLYLNSRKDRWGEKKKAPEVSRKEIIKTEAKKINEMK